MKKILQALDGASTKPVEGSNDMKKFLRVVNEEAPVAQQQSPEQIAYNQLRAQLDSADSLRGGGAYTDVSPEVTASTNAMRQKLAQMAAALKAKGIDAEAEYNAPDANVPAAAPVDLKKYNDQDAVAEDVGMSRLLSIISEGRGPLNRPTTAESLTMQHYTETKKTITAPVLNVAEDAKPSMIGKYFKAVEQELKEAANRNKDRARQLAERVSTKMEKGIAEDDAGDVEQRFAAKMEKEKQRLAKLKQTDPEAYKREMAKSKTSGRVPPVSTFEDQGVAEGAGFDKWADDRAASQLHKLKPATTWEVSYDYGPHMSKSVTVKASSEQEARVKVEKAAEKRGLDIMINSVTPASQVNEFAPDGFNGGDDGEEFNPNLAKMAYDEGVVKGASLADGATLERAMAINDWDKHDGGIYSQHFAKGFIAGRKDKIRHNNKQYNLNLKLMKDGSIRHGEQGVAEGSEQYTYKDIAEMARLGYSDSDIAEHLGFELNEGLKDPKDNPCWKGYKPVGTKKKGGKTVPNCVPK